MTLCDCQQRSAHRAAVIFNLKEYVHMYSTLQAGIGSCDTCLRHSVSTPVSNSAQKHCSGQCQRQRQSVTAVAVSSVAVWQHRVVVLEHVELSCTLIELRAYVNTASGALTYCTCAGGTLVCTRV
eukprot:1651-Heterococcus_DN1.PRE.1